VAEGQGLFDGFEAQRTPTDADYSAVLRHGLVVPDTNVLLDLYRMNARVREDMLTVLGTVAERIWVPHQVIAEFWRNRQSEELIAYHDRKADATKGTLLTSIQKSRKAIGDWAKDVHIGDDSDMATPLYEKLNRAEKIFESVMKMLDSQAVKDRVPGIRDTNADPVIIKLESLLDGRVGPPYDERRYSEEIVRAKERADRQIPPGYLDFESGRKGDEEAAGDYLIWRQILDEVQGRAADVLFVTRDGKDDWWRKSSSKAARLPRIELVDEFREHTGRRLFMVEPSVLMQKASRTFRLENQVHRNSVVALQYLESSQSGTEDSYRSGVETRYRLAQLPGGRSGDYVETVWTMCQLVDDNPRLAICIEKFMDCFPSITLGPEARRRLMNLVALGLAIVQDERILLTSAGKRFHGSRDPELLSRLFMERIEGAFEARSMLRQGAEVADLKALISEHSELDLSATQIDLLLRWMSRLGLLAE
jgi:hypothetical protein